MAVTLKRLYMENENPFQLTVEAGFNGIRNSVSWLYMMEDEDIISFFHGAELAVTTGMKMLADKSWLRVIVEKLVQQRAAGLIVNVGKFVTEIPQDVLKFCEENDFPILTMPWKIQITKMMQDFCLAIINQQHENVLHDQAIRDVIQHPNHIILQEPTLEQYYNLRDHFAVMVIYAKFREDSQDEANIDVHSNMEYWLTTRLSHLRTEMRMPKLRIGIVRYENAQVLIISHAGERLLRRISETVLYVYEDVKDTHDVYLGIGTVIPGMENIGKSYIRAVTAVKMAQYRDEKVVWFQNMGIYKLLFAVKDEEILYEYADEILAPLDAYDEKKHQYLELLKAYIEQDRSLEETAKVRYIHRNTVNYQIRKIKELLGSPLKTAEDLFPYQVAFAIRDMQKKKGNYNESLRP